MATANGIAKTVGPKASKRQVEPSLELNVHANSILEAPPQIVVAATIVGTSKMLFHRYDVESVEAKGKAGKGTAAKKTDDVQSYYYRDDDGNLCVPGGNLHSALILSAKSFQDPRSPRKSARDLIVAGLIVDPELAPLISPAGEHYTEGDFMDRRRVTVQQSAIARTRPGVEAGWTMHAEIRILQPDLISVELLSRILVNAGACVGLCDFRPRYGRFRVARCEAVALED